MSTAAPEAPAVTPGEAPTETAPPAPSTTPDAPSAQPETPAPAPAETPTPEPKLETVDDLGEGPDGDPVEGEDQLAKLKRIARREAREKRELEGRLSTERDQAIARAEAAEQEKVAAVNAASELPTVKEKLAKAETNLLRYEIAAAQNPPLTVQQAEFLQGSTREEIEASAARYVAVNAMPAASPTPPRTREDERAFVERMNRTRR